MGVSTLAAAAIIASSMPGSTGTAIFAPNDHDIILCRAWEGDAVCQGNITPAVFAGKAGYKTLYKVGVMFNDNKQYIVMEVSK